MMWWMFSSMQIIQEEYSIAESISNDQTPEALDVADVSVGLVGLSSTVLVAAGIISNPVGWSIGLGVTIYGAG